MVDQGSSGSNVSSVGKEIEVKLNQNRRWIGF